jgi:hypothetical protein
MLFIKTPLREKIESLKSRLCLLSNASYKENRYHFVQQPWVWASLIQHKSYRIIVPQKGV